jgi:ribosomal protein L16 Arg81 hydroxylase
MASSPRSFEEELVGFSLQDLIAPMGPEEFLRSFWGQTPLYIPGHKDKFQTLFSMDRLQQRLRPWTPAQSRPRHSEFGDLLIRASFDRGRNPVRVAPFEAMHLYNAGATLCIDGIASADRRLMSTARNIRRELNYVGPADFRVYLSPDGQGFDTHFDARIATTLQISGRKRWTFSGERALEWPPYPVNSGEGRVLEPSRQIQKWEEFKHPKDCSFQEVILQPGDVLCLPAGCWHSAQAIGHSLALNLAFGGPGVSWGILSSVLTALLIQQPGWRSPPPPVLESRITDGRLPDAVESFFQARAEELIELLVALRRDSEPLYQAWLQSQKGSAEVASGMGN